ncbi:hypothetical protein [Desulfovibrio sp.]|uniref:hypothetical protein n=1 Tax=Desulfovibrio sp. TaxID=885 RepID=UPI0023CC6132|nr:hypothetical protein [Desulfovibrio sp.]MDE7241573.1 hypothetical protein [Desulfovibrio sp.]
MNRAWLARRRPALVRDLVRDYCAAHMALTAQLRRFEGDGTVSHAIIRALLGEAVSKGVLWRLKDTAHHLFRSEAPPDAADGRRAPEERALVGELIDWCVGFAFHECIKLREDAYQRQHYANRLLHLEAQWREAPGHAPNPADTQDAAPDALWPLAGLPRQTADSMERELRRILRVLDEGLALLARYLAGEGGNAPLARWLAVEEDRAAAIFGPRWPGIVDAFRGPDGDGLYPLAARDLMEAGRPDAALDLLRAHRHCLGASGRALLGELEAAGVPAPAGPAHASRTAPKRSGAA